MRSRGLAHWPYLVPGMGDLRSTYRHVAPTLRDAGFRVVLTDLRGHGDSDTTFTTYGDEATAGDLIALVEHLGGPAVLVGNSMGAGAAALVAALRPDLVSGLVLIGPFMRDPELSIASRLMLRLAMAPVGGASMGLILSQAQRRHAPRGLRQPSGCDRAQPVSARIRTGFLADHPPDDARSRRGAPGAGLRAVPGDHGGVGPRLGRSCRGGAVDRHDAGQRRGDGPRCGPLPAVPAARDHLGVDPGPPCPGDPGCLGQG